MLSRVGLVETYRLSSHEGTSVAPVPALSTVQEKVAGWPAVAVDGTVTELT